MNKTFIPAILILLVVYILHVSGSDFGFYNDFWWYDIMMHALGGFGIALSLYWFFKTLYKKNLERFSFSKVIFFSIIAGIGWEAMEAYYGIASAPFGTLDYYLDSSGDIINDIIGSLIAIFLIKKINK